MVISLKIKKRSLPFSLSPVMLLDIVEIDSNDWCAAKFVQLISCAGRQTSLGTTGISVLIIRIVSWFEQAPDESDGSNRKSSCF